MIRAQCPRVTYPFSAVVGMDDMRLALLLNAVSPAVPASPPAGADACRIDDPGCEACQ